MEGLARGRIPVRASGRPWAHALYVRASAASGVNHCGSRTASTASTPWGYSGILGQVQYRSTRCATRAGGRPGLATLVSTHGVPAGLLTSTEAFFRLKLKDSFSGDGAFRWAAFAAISLPSHPTPSTARRRIHQLAQRHPHRADARSRTHRTYGDCTHRTALHALRPRAVASAELHCATVRQSSTPTVVSPGFLTGLGTGRAF